MQGKEKGFTVLPGESEVEIAARLKGSVWLSLGKASWSLDTDTKVLEKSEFSSLFKKEKELLFSIKIRKK